MEVRSRSKRFKKSNHLTTTTTTTDDGGIPDWLLFELLLRLPPNRVFACTLVSKQWLSMASSPHFIRAYASRAESASQPYWTVLPPYFSGSKPITPREIYLRQPRLSGIRLPTSRGLGNYVVMGANDGLLLYYSCQHTMSGSISYVFYVGNPITGQWIEAGELGDSPLSFLRGDSWGFLTRVDDEPPFALRSYCIVRAGGPTPDGSVTFDVYYSETGEWNKFAAALPPSPGWLEMQASSAALDGILHWAELNLGVIAFDPADPNRQTMMRVIPGPRDAERPHDSLRMCLCAEYRGELRYFGGYEGRNYELPGFSIWRWLGGDEWCMQHKIGGSRVAETDGGVLHYSIEIRSLFLDPCDPDVVYCVALSGRYNSRLVFSYDLKSGRLRQRLDMMVAGDGGFGAGALPWALLLVVPPWPTRVAEELLDRHLDL